MRIPVDTVLYVVARNGPTLKITRAKIWRALLSLECLAGSYQPPPSSTPKMELASHDEKNILVVRG